MNVRGNMTLCKNAMFMIQRSGYAKKVITQRASWTAEESQLLKDLVAKHGKYWTFLESFFEGRKANTLSSRYHYLAKKENIRTWKLVEDKLLISSIETYGNNDWDKIEKEFEGQRTKEELAARYEMIKNTNNSFSHWSKLESFKLLYWAKRYDNDWGLIADKIGTRTRGQCYNRYIRTKHIFNPDDEENIKITKEDAERLVKAVQEYGRKFKAIKAKLQLQDTAQELEEIYRTQLDPSFCRDKWTKEETSLLVDLYRELDGHMKLVQTRLSKKRSLHDLWEQYYKATQAI